jgi:hypothetical protein
MLRFLIDECLRRPFQETLRVKRPSLLASCFVGCGLAVCVIQASASELNGTIKGSIDGHKIDVKVACSAANKPWDWLIVKSDPTDRPGPLNDLNGDGIAIQANTARGAASATWLMKVGQAVYNFSATGQAVTYNDNGYRVATKLDRMEGKGKDRRVVSSYQVDLTVACRGI